MWEQLGWKMDTCCKCQTISAQTVRNVEACGIRTVIQALVLTCGSHQSTLAAFIYQAKKTQEKEAASKQVPQKAETKPKESCQPTQLPAQEGNADVAKTNTTGSKKEGRKQRAVPGGKPAEGTSTKLQEQTK